jgi:hypothetical protein
LPITYFNVYLGDEYGTRRINSDSFLSRTVSGNIPGSVTVQLDDYGSTYYYIIIGNGVYNSVVSLGKYMP